ncbi:uncharacterized protein PGTG_18471 [Puccinia graminis f. sp. tritici CRL 75-36-700-3]|uniref:Uncharacterized protein n=1 Tax=Puccinia graminis f. sp. tritici (strain CRL 75-36-700-3 / race SCCL) TaxID=418459 RepID=E3L6T1_PUCGT|nr:uncharacterized protein PGTG_18471 [Puccinia graminis f. sp. tritici CRL 75-36-700-3]EFP92256.1 hypothetical protein PGTG_18471 [Puccinia graminis f. sp. tritici CRL 75-36-700-3]
MAGRVSTRMGRASKGSACNREGLGRTDEMGENEGAVDETDNRSMYCYVRQFVDADLPEADRREKKAKRLAWLLGGTWRNWKGEQLRVAHVDLSRSKLILCTSEFMRQSRKIDRTLSYDGKKMKLPNAGPSDGR